MHQSQTGHRFVLFLLLVLVGCGARTNHTSTFSDNTVPWQKYIECKDHQGQAVLDFKEITDGNGEKKLFYQFVIRNRKAIDYITERKGFEGFNNPSTLPDEVVLPNLQICYDYMTGCHPEKLYLYGLNTWGHRRYYVDRNNSSEITLRVFETALMYAEDVREIAYWVFRGCSEDR